MAGRKQKLKYLEETLWFPEYNIGWIGIGNCGQKTSIIYVGGVQSDWPYQGHVRKWCARVH